MLFENLPTAVMITGAIWHHLWLQLLLKLPGWSKTHFQGVLILKFYYGLHCDDISTCHHRLRAMQNLWIT